MVWAWNPLLSKAAGFWDLATSQGTLVFTPAVPLRCCVSHVKSENACLFATLLPKGIAACLSHRVTRSRGYHILGRRQKCVNPGNV